MKIGRIALVTALSLLFPLAALAGPPPCPSPDDDPDGDGVCTSDDNCPDTPNPGQEDSDVTNEGIPRPDGQGDACDNCIFVANGPDAGPYPGATPGFQHDSDSDGYGNACDCDLSNDGFGLAADYSFLFQPCIQSGPFCVSGCEEADMDGNGFCIASDYSFYFEPCVNADPTHPPGPFMLNRSGLICINPEGGPTPPGSCPPHN